MLFEKVRLSDVKLEHMEATKNCFVTASDLSENEQYFTVGNEKEMLNKMSKNEKFQYSLCKACEYISRTSFLAGLLFLISFGIITLSIIV